MRAIDKLTTLLVLLGACTAGPTLYVGNAPAPRASSIDAGAGDAPSGADAGDDADDDDDDDHIRCVNTSECSAFSDTPYCSSERERCVECLEDSQCDAGEICKDGDCED